MLKKMPPPKEKKKDQYDLIVGNHVTNATPIEREHKKKKNKENNNRIFLM
jgi:hypothetical protein